MARNSARCLGGAAKGKSEEEPARNRPKTPISQNGGYLALPRPRGRVILAPRAGKAYPTRPPGHKYGFGVLLTPGCEGGEKSTSRVIPSEDFMILRLTTVHENPGSAGIMPAVAGHRALDEVAGRMPALPFSWQRGIDAQRGAGRSRHLITERHPFRLIRCTIHA